MFTLKRKQQIQKIEHHYAHQLSMPHLSYDTHINEEPVFINEYSNQPCSGAITQATVGISLCMQLELNYELLFCAYRHDHLSQSAKLLASIASQLVYHRQQLKHGDLLGPSGPLLTYTQMNSLYVCYPNYFNKNIYQFNLLERVISVFWLIPLYQEEALWVDQYGRKAFELYLEQFDPDLLDLNRVQINLNQDNISHMS